VAEKKVSVLITAKDGLTGVLRSTRSGLKSWSTDVTKIFAGIGLADSAKEIGRFIRDSIKLAADSYPKLGAGLKSLSEGFTEFRIQAGAAFLEVLQPAVPLLQSVLGWATKLAKQLPDAFDGVRIVLAEIGGWFRQLPAMGEQAFGRLAVAAAGFADKAAFVIELFGGSGAIDKAGALNAFGNRLIQEGTRARRAIDAETAGRVGGLAAATHGFGARALTEEQKKVGRLVKLDDGRVVYVLDAVAEQGVMQAGVDIRGAGGANVIGRPGQGIRKSGLGRVDAGALPTGEAFQGMSEGAADFGNSLRDTFDALGLFNMEAENTNQILGHMVAGVVIPLSEVWAEFGANLTEGTHTLEGFKKAAVSAVAGAAIAEGKIGVAKGFAKIAEGAFPPNPPLIASGLAMVAKNTALIALAGAFAGGTGGSGAGGGSGSLSAGGFTSSSQQSAQGRGLQEVKIKANPGDILNLNSPGGQRILAEAIRAAAYARTIEIDLTGAA